MNFRKRFIIVSIALVMSFAAAGLAFAQTTDTTPTTGGTATNDDLQAEIESVDSTAQIDDTALLTRLSAQFSVELSVLQDLRSQGYTAGQIWLALEISAQSGAQLTDAVTQAASLNMEGHGWGALAQALGIDPGSKQFFALKEQMRTRTRDMASEVGSEHGNKVRAEEQNEYNEQNRLGSSNKPEGAGEHSSGGNGDENRGGKH